MSITSSPTARCRKRWLNWSEEHFPVDDGKKLRRIKRKT
jgi:hypothetical protein